MNNRLVQFPNRYKLVSTGEADTYEVIPSPGEVTDLGTPLNKETLLSDPVAARYGLNTDGTLTQAFERNVQQIAANVPASGWSAELNAEGWFTNQVNVEGMLAVYEPLLTLVPTSATLVEDEKANFGLIMEAETFDGYVVFKVLDAPDMDLNVRFVGV